MSAPAPPTRSRRLSDRTLLIVLAALVVLLLVAVGLAYSVIRVPPMEPVPIPSASQR